MRFTVLARGNRDTVFTPISAPGLGTWRAAERGVARYRVNQVVNNLTSGTAYRAVIDFRWRNAAGRVIRTLTRRTPQCAVDARPDLSWWTASRGARSGPAWSTTWSRSRTAAPRPPAT
jgi:hypothetical protein